MDLVRSGKMKILFVAPERLNNEGGYYLGLFRIKFLFTDLF